MKIDLLGGSFTQKYLDISTQQTVNWYPVPISQIEKGKTQFALYPRPGLTLFCNISGRYSRGGIRARTTKYDRKFCVVDQTLYEINANQTVTNQGSLSNIAYGSSKCIFKVNGNQEVFIGHYTASYVFNMDTNTLTQITDVNFPNNVISADYIDGYLHVVANGQVYFSMPNSFLNWTSVNGQQVFHPTFKAANSVAVGAYRDKLFVFSSQTIEPYYEDGSSAVWARYPAAIINIGLENPNLLAVFDQGLIFVGTSETSSGKHIYYLQNEWSMPQSISEKTPSIQWKINSQPNLMSEAWCYVQKTKTGQNVFKLFIPGLKTTLCYDFNSQEWFEEQSYKTNDSDGTLNLDIFKGINFISGSIYNLYQDAYSGNLFYEDYTSLTDNGTMIKRIRTSSTYFEEYKNISVEQFEIDGTKGEGSLTYPNPVLMLEESIDGGHTFNAPRNILLGSLGNYLFRTRIQKLGTGRNWVLRLIQTDAYDLMIQNAFANGIIGVH